MSGDPAGQDVRVDVLGFDELDGPTAYAVWRLRQDVFVVEQACAYPDLDGRDDEPGTRHVLLRAADGSDGADGPGRLVGYLRVLTDPDGVRRIGRVVLHRDARGRGLADPLVRAALAEVGESPSRLDAQSPLARFYAGYGYEVSGPEFLEDGIPHVPMTRP
ncbi:GNAT family N-acetyltransferase [Nocardioides sp. CFH 31398]|uniref:GNAT family N-acetyltransferase n=1 Tax=Nocardioides sp. CFH 31398 TaxID=2919579 RepID=UPI001F06C90D|nr:GNAT family N-acetyltransferase [Nocardioides sp. CFH 31398]MCH1866158.1 GNAT family N-acetyltransferase [Nocardioides sp. CFH 31398]